MVAIDHSRVESPQAEDAEISGVSLLGSFVIVARQHGMQLSVPQLVHDHLLEPGQPSVSQLLNIASASSLRATRVRLSWSQLLKLGKALPAIVLLRNGQAMVLRDVNEGPETPRILLQDPNAHEESPLLLDELRFTAAWTGEVLLFKRDYRLRDEDQPFGLWLIIAQLVRDRRIARDRTVLHAQVRRPHRERDPAARQPGSRRQTAEHLDSLPDWLCAAQIP